MNNYLITYDDGKTIKVKHLTKGLAEVTLKKIMPKIVIKSTIKLPKDETD